MRHKLTKVLSLLLLTLLILSSLTSCTLSFWTDGAFAEISESSPLLPEGTLLTDPGDCEDTSDYLISWGIHSFRPQKLNTIERYYETYYVNELPSTFDRATSLYSAYRDTVRGVNPIYLDADTVTGILISLFQEVVGDEFAVYMDGPTFSAFIAQNEAQAIGIGIQTTYDPSAKTLTVTDVCDGSPAKEAGIAVGDLVIAVNGTRLDSIGYDAFYTMLGGEEGSTLSLTVERNGSELTFEQLTRREIEITSVFYETITYLEKTYARIRITEFSHKTDEQFKAALDRAEREGVYGVIYDVRDNPGGAVDAVVAMLDYLLPDGYKLAHFRYREGSGFSFESETYYAEDRHAVDLPAIVLCDENTASASELFTATLSDYDYATVVGTTTFGKGVAQNLFSLIDGSGFTVSTSYYDPASGNNYNGKGITPDYTVILPDDVKSIPLSMRHYDTDTQIYAALTLLSSR